MLLLGGNEAGESLHPKSIPLPKVGCRDARALGWAGSDGGGQQLHPGKTKHRLCSPLAPENRMERVGGMWRGDSTKHFCAAHPHGTGIVPPRERHRPAAAIAPQTDAVQPPTVLATLGGGQPAWLGGAWQ